MVLVKVFWFGKSLVFCILLNSGFNKILGGCGVIGVFFVCIDSVVKYKKI